MVRVLRLLPLLMLAGALLLGLPACEDDFGEACSLPTKVREACRQGNSSGSGLESHINCVMEENLDCSSRTCVVYEDSDPFCSMSCETDGDCPSGARCLDFILESEFHCVPKDQIPAES